MDKVIHLVEDDEDIRFVIDYILREIGYTVEIFGTIAAFEARSISRPPDLIILDVMLPDGNGIDLCVQLKANSATALIPIIIMSAHSTEKAVLEAACAEEFISKPFDLDELTARIEKYVPLIPE